jgi:hypothetical protein
VISLERKDSKNLESIAKSLASIDKTLKSILEQNKPEEEPKANLGFNPWSEENGFRKG